MCQARPCSHVEIAPKRVERRALPLRKTLTATVFRVVRLAADISILTLRFANGVRARFQAGQYLQILLPDGDRRNFSVANPPHDNDGAELHIRHYERGVPAANGRARGDVQHEPFGQCLGQRGDGELLLFT